MRTTHDQLLRHGLGEAWDTTALATEMTIGKWKDRVYEAVEGRSYATRHFHMLDMSSTAEYMHTKEWGPTTQRVSPRARLGVGGSARLRHTLMIVPT